MQLTRLHTGRCFPTSTDRTSTPRHRRRPSTGERTALTTRLFCLWARPGRPFFCPEFYDSRYQTVRYWFVERELHRALAAFVLRQFVLEISDAARSRIKADVIFEGGKMDHI